MFRALLLVLVCNLLSGCSGVPNKVLGSFLERFYYEDEKRGGGPGVDTKLQSYDPLNTYEVSLNGETVYVKSVRVKIWVSERMFLGDVIPSKVYESDAHYAFVKRGGAWFVAGWDYSTNELSSRWINCDADGDSLRDRLFNRS